jgi:DNA-binding transcriptional LysR family regulator
MIGVPVFDRTARGVSPTIFGDALLMQARSMEVQLINTLRDITALKHNTSGSLRIWRDAFDGQSLSVNRTAGDLCRATRRAGKTA